MKKELVPLVFGYLIVAAVMAYAFIGWGCGY